MAEITLVERVKKDLSGVKLGGVTVKVTKLDAKKPKKAKLQNKIPKTNKTPISSIIHILIKNALEETKKGTKKAKQTADDKKYALVREEKDESSSGYGVVSRFYGITPAASYIDYGKLFSYLGKFRAKGAYSADNPLEFLNKPVESDSLALVDAETMDKGARYVKYMKPQVVDMYISTLSLVPIAGMNSDEWEKFKLWMNIDRVMYILKGAIA